MQTQAVRVLRAFYFQGKPVKVGEVVELPKVFAKEMIAANKAEDPVAAKPAEQKPAQAAKGGANAR